VEFLFENALLFDKRVNGGLLVTIDPPDKCHHDEMEYLDFFHGRSAYLPEMATATVSVTILFLPYKVKVPALGTSVFIIPGRQVKNGYDRLIVLNRIASSVVNEQWGKHPTHILPFMANRPLGC
jgi:hypothetical protein